METIEIAKGIKKLDIVRQPTKTKTLLHEICKKIIDLEKALKPEKNAAQGRQ